VHVDAVLVGVFLKRQHKFAELRPMATALCVWLVLPLEIDDPRITRRERISQERFAHSLKLRKPKDFDARVKEWLSLAFHAAA
jgi:cytidylate kinase